MKKIIQLSLSLAKANFKLRNEGSYLGFLWYLLSPLSYFAVIILVKGTVFSGIDIANYPLYLILGLVMYHFFIHTVGDSIGIIQSNAGLIKSVKIPHEALVISRAIQSVYSHIFELILLCIFLFYYGLSLINIIYYIPLFILFFVFTLGISLIFSAIGIFLTDLRSIWGIFTQLLFFITPIFHLPVEGSLLSKINAYNPLAYFLEAGREVFIYSVLPSFSLISAVLISSLLSLGVGWWVFQKAKVRFAELV